MKQTKKVERLGFIEEMQKDYPNNFSREGLGELFFYLEFQEQEDNEEIDLDTRVICNQFSQASLDDFLIRESEHLKNWGDIDIQKLESEEEKQEVIKDFIEFAGFWYEFVEGNKEIIYENF